MPQRAPTLDEQAGSQAGPAVETGPGVEGRSATHALGPCLGQYVCTSDAPSDVPSGTPLSKYAHLIRHSAKMAVPAVIYLIM